MKGLDELTPEMLARVAAVAAPCVLDRVEQFDYGAQAGLLFTHGEKRTALRLSPSRAVLNRKWWQFWRRKWRSERLKGDEIEVELYRCAISARKKLVGTTAFEAMEGGEERLRT